MRASQATIELLLLLLLLPRPGYLHSTGCQFEAHPQAIGTGALTHIEDARVIFIEISAICADFYMGIHYALCQSVNVYVCMCVCVLVIVGNMLCDKCPINSPWIGGEIARILPNRIKRLRRQTCLGFCCYHDQKTWATN